jgi:hypothetical protein
MTIKHKYKKYILFQFEGLYPGGGVGDITNSFNTIKETKEYIKKNSYEFNEIINRDTWEEVEFD